MRHLCHGRLAGNGEDKGDGEKDMDIGWPYIHRAGRGKPSVPIAKQ
jgi:hypothetical protein